MGKDDPAGIVRIQSGLPASGEALEPFANSYLVSGWMRGSFNGPIMPVGLNNSMMTRFDGPPRVAAMGFVLKDGKLHGPVDMFNDVAFDFARTEALQMANYIRKMGVFEPHRLPDEDMEYTALPRILEKLAPRFKNIEDKGAKSEMKLER